MLCVLISFPILLFIRQVNWFCPWVNCRWRSAYLVYLRAFSQTRQHIPLMKQWFTMAHLTLLTLVMHTPSVWLMCKTGILKIYSFMCFTLLLPSAPLLRIHYHHLALAINNGNWSEWSVISVWNHFSDFKWKSWAFDFKIIEYNYHFLKSILKAQMSVAQVHNFLVCINILLI